MLKYTTHVQRESSSNRRKCRGGKRNLEENDMLYISNFRGKWFIQKQLNGTQERFCIPCDDLEWVKKERDWAFKCDWDWDAIVNQDYDEYMVLGKPVSVKNGRIMIEGALTYV